MALEQLVLDPDQLADAVVRDLESLQDLRFGNLYRSPSTIRMASSLPATTISRSEYSSC